MNLTGMTEAMCPNECNVEGCVISGKPYCGHSAKGGLHAGEMQDPAALRRAEQARNHLELAKFDAKRAAQKTD